MNSHFLVPTIGGFGLTLAAGLTLPLCNEARADDPDFYLYDPVMDSVTDLPVAVPTIPVPLKSLCVQLESGVDAECLESPTADLTVSETSTAWTKATQGESEGVLALAASFILLVTGIMVGDKLARNDVKNALENMSDVLQKAADSIDGPIATQQDVYKACEAYRRVRHLLGVFMSFGLSELAGGVNTGIVKSAEQDLRAKLMVTYQMLKADKTRGPEASALYATLHPEEHVYYGYPI